jgi:hypothetical protein
MSNYPHLHDGLPNMQNDIYPPEQYDGRWETVGSQPQEYKDLQETDFDALLAGDFENLEDKYSHPANANFETVTPELSQNIPPHGEPSMYEYQPPNYLPHGYPPPASPTWAPQTFNHLPNFLEPAAYRHDILAQFPSPTLPLRVIDHVGYPLGPHVMEALQLALNQRAQINTSGILKRRSVAPAAPAVNERPRSPVRPVKNPEKPWVKPNHKTAGKNARSANIRGFDATRVYDKLPRRPRSWGRKGEYGLPEFQYTDDGELVSGFQFNQDRLIRYLMDHPGHQIDETSNTKNSGLIIWIQSVPADSAARYATALSDKCRWEGCPVPNGTIHKGHYRVAFDEQSWSKGDLDLDPYNNAGYMHLYCLEKNIDFARLCKDFNVQPDTRVFPHEPKNRMAVTRDHPEMRNIVMDFINNQPGWDINNPYRYEETLSYKLTTEHIRLEPGARRNVRERRGGNTIDKHLNNLKAFIDGNKDMRTKKGRAERNANKIAESRPAKKTSPKRKRNSEDESAGSDADFEIDGDVFAMDSSAPVLRKRQRR